jgi:hypothetical protein
MIAPAFLLIAVFWLFAAKADVRLTEYPLSSV